MVATPFPTVASELATVRLEIRELHPQIIAWRRCIHQQPELGFQEKVTAEFIAEKLTSWGIEYQTGIAQTGIVATISGDRPGKVLAIRADMDALPIQELNSVEYRSQRDGVMHACGHDGHVAIALGTARYLATHRNFAGTVKMIFQPAEEGPGGAEPMVQAGVLQNPDVDAIVGLHLWNQLPLGTVGVRSGALMAAVETFNCTIRGKGGHGAIPQQTVDSIVVAAQVVTALQTIVSRNVDPIESAVVTIGKFHAGTACNIIADSAQLSGTVRYFNPNYVHFFQQRIEQVIAGVCQTYGATYELDYRKLYPALINDEQMTTLVRSVAETAIESPLNVVPNCQTMGGEDMSYFLNAVPGCYFFLGSANAARGLTFPHHHPRFDIDETALALGVELFVRCVERFCAL
ncbi:MAG: M20 family metallopeptidase [Synechococcales bacterium]|nr:M20 family metallopeptidase [Synechococcales bacterium]